MEVEKLLHMNETRLPIWQEYERIKKNKSKRDVLLDKTLANEKKVFGKIKEV